MSVFERSFEACMFSCLLPSLPLLWPIVFPPSFTLFFSFFFLPPPLASHQWLRDECCVRRSGDETLLGGGHSGVPGECGDNLPARLRTTSWIIALAFGDKRSISLPHTHTLVLCFYVGFSLSFQLTDATSCCGCWLAQRVQLYFIEPAGDFGTWPLRGPHTPINTHSNHKQWPVKGTVDPQNEEIHILPPCSAFESI